MKHYKYSYWFVGLLMMGSVALAAQPARMDVRMVAADNRGGGSDPALNDVLPHLQRMGFKRYRQTARQTVSLQEGQKQWVQLGDGHAMVLKVIGTEGDSVRLQVVWRKDGREVANLEVLTKPGAPFVIGGPQVGGTTYIAIFKRR